MFRLALRRSVAVLTVALALMAPAGAAEPESSDPIVFALNDWTGQHITSRIMGGVLAKAGYSVKYVEVDYEAQFADLETGKLTVSMEIWATTGT